MRARLAGALAVLVVLASSAPAAAQGNDPPPPDGTTPASEAGPPPPEPGSPFAGRVAGTAGQQRPLVWTLSFSAQEAYESNVLSGYFLAPGETAGDFLTRLGAKLSRRFPAKRARFGLTLDGGGSIYREVTDLNRFTWAASADGGYDLSRRLAVDVQASSSLGYVRDFIRLDVDSTLAPYTLTRYDDGRATVRIYAARDTVVRLEARGYRYDFQGDTLLTNGKTFVAGARVSHSFSSGTLLGGTAEYERTSSGPTYEVERAFLTFRKRVARGWEARLEAGAARHRQLPTVPPIVLLPGVEDPTEARISPVGSGVLDGSYDRHSLRAAASRSVSQTYGFGSVGKVDTVSLAYGFGPIHRVTFVLTAEGARVYQVPVGFPPDNLNLGGGLRWQAAKRLTFVLDGYRWSRHGGAIVDSPARWNGYAVSLSLAYDFAWR
jgi:hypothetical protein